MVSDGHPVGQHGAHRGVVVVHQVLELRGQVRADTAPVPLLHAVQQSTRVAVMAE